MPIVVAPPQVIHDVEIILGRGLTDAENDRLDRLTEMAYAIIEGALPGFSIAAGTATDERIVHDDPDVAWTERYPVTAVTEVRIGDAVLSDTSYRWTDRGRIELGRRCILNEFEINLTGYAFGEDLTVAYGYGMADPAPDEVLTVVAQMVAGVLRTQATNPDGVTSTRLGAFEESYGPQGNPGFARIEGAATLLRRWSRSRAVSVPLIRRR